MSYKWNAELYDSSHGFVPRYGQSVADILKAGSDEEILDIGCGTGYLTDYISQQAKSVTGLDSSADMIEKAEKKYPSIDFRRGDIRSFNLERQFDAVFSNAVLHWVPEAGTAAVNIRRHMKPDARFVADLGGRGCVKSILQALNDSFGDIPHPDAFSYFYYPSVGEYSAVLEDTGFEVVYAALFDRPTPLEGGEQGLTNFIKMFLQWMFAETDDKTANEVIAAAEAELRPLIFRDGSWIADYRRLQIIAVNRQ